MRGRPARAALLHGALALVGVAATFAGLWALSAVTVLWLVAVALARHPSKAPWHLPTAWVLLVAATSVLALGANALGSDVLAHTVPSRALVACGVLAAGAACMRRLTSSAEDVPSETAPWRTFSAAAVLACTGLVLVALPGTRSVQWAVGADHIHHLLFVAQVDRVGSLDYAVASYPRAWHTLPATLAAVGDVEGGPGSLGRLVAVTATSTWASFVVLVMATAVAAARYAAAMGTGRRTPWAGALAGWLVLWPTVSVDYLGFGFQTSLFAATILAVVVAECLRSPGSTRSVVVGVLATGVMCHVWQLLVPVVGLATTLAVATWLRTRRRSPRSLAALAVGVGMVALYAAPALTAVLGVGLEHATDAGLRPRVPYVLALLGMLASVGLLLRSWRAAGSATGPWSRFPALLVAATAVATAGLGVALAARFGLSPLTYYPGKLLWHCAVLGMIALPTAAWQVVRAAGGRATFAVVPVATSVVVVVGLVAPVSAVAGRLSNVDADLVLAAATTPEASRAQVVWLSGTEYDDLVTRVLLRHDDPLIDPTGRSDSYPSRAQECALLRDADRPAVLSDRSAAEVRSRYACAPDVTVVPVADAH